MKASTNVISDPNTVLDRARQMLDKGQAQAALDVLDSCGQSSRIIQNAKGVCMMRLGRHEPAVKIFRDLVFPGGALAIPDETPTIFRSNYATSLLLVDNIVTGLQMLGQIPDRRHPAVVQLKGAVRSWKRSMSFFARIGLVIGITPRKPFRMDSAPGALLIPWNGESPRPVERAA
jgi:hypothetical protein